MATTCKLIQTITVGSGGASAIQFTSIPQTYTDLIVKYSVKSTTANSQTDNLDIKFNNSSSNFTVRTLSGNGSSTSSGNYSLSYLGYTPGTVATNVFTNGEFYVPNYAGNTYKSISSDIVSEANTTTAYIFMNALLWSQTSAITQIDLFYTGSDTFGQYSTAYLYGIKNS